MRLYCQTAFFSIPIMILDVYDGYDYEQYSDAYGCDDEQYNDTYDTTIPKSPPSPVLVIKDGGSWMDIDGDPYNLDFENDVDEFYEQYLNYTYSYFEDERVFFRTVL